MMSLTMFLPVCDQGEGGGEEEEEVDEEEGGGKEVGGEEVEVVTKVPAAPSGVTRPPLREVQRARGVGGRITLTSNRPQHDRQR
jgi:hypothetical protein